MTTEILKQILKRKTNDDSVSDRSIKLLNMIAHAISNNWSWNRMKIWTESTNEMKKEKNKTTYYLFETRFMNNSKVKTTAKIDRRYFSLQFCCISLFHGIKKRQKNKNKVKQSWRGIFLLFTDTLTPPHTWFFFFDSSVHSNGVNAVVVIANTVLPHVSHMFYEWNEMFGLSDVGTFKCHYF